jgi:hypothetical protein
LNVAEQEVDAKPQVAAGDAKIRTIATEANANRMIGLSLAHRRLPLQPSNNVRTPRTSENKSKL